MDTAIVWLRRDLRLDDNPALAAAARRARAVIPVWIHEPDAPRGDGTDWWLPHSLRDLDRSLRARDSRLMLRRGPAMDCLHALVAETGAGAVYWNRRYEPDEVQRDRGIFQSLRESGVEVQSFRAALLREPWELATGAGTPYRVFTPFWQAFRRAGEMPAPISRPSRIPAPARWPQSEAVEALDIDRDSTHHRRALGDHWQPGESGARTALERFLRRGLSHYAGGRDHPAEDGVSRLSPHLHFGELSPARAWKRVARRMESDPDSREGGEAWLRQLVWREFAHHVLFHFPHTPDQPMYRRWRHFPWREDHEDLLAAWREGRTGYPIVDAGMRELWETGWMHNRVRMLVASLLVKNMRVPWQSGAAWFLETLVDADLANNTLGWQWCAGCGADAAPYFRIFNPFTQSRRFDPEGRYIRRWLPELAALPARYRHAPHEAPESVLADASLRLDHHYPRPVIDYADSRREALAAAEKARGR